MKKTLILLVSAVLMLTSCTTNTGTGAFLGGAAGAILGSAIGGVTGGPWGRDLGTAVGMAGGAAIGAAIGAQQDVNESNKASQSTPTVRSGYDPSGRGDDTLYDFNSSEYTGNYSATSPEHVEYIESSNSVSASGLENPSIPLEINNARFVDGNQDYRLTSNEYCKVIFEIHNDSEESIYDVQPVVVETSGMKNIEISNSIHVEEIQPGQSLRYTAMVKSGKLKEGVANFRIYVQQGNGRIISNVSAFNVITAK